MLSILLISALQEYAGVSVVNVSVIAMPVMTYDTPLYRSMLVDPVVIDIKYNLTIAPSYAIYLENDTVNVTVNVVSGVLTQADKRGNNIHEYRMFYK